VSGFRRLYQISSKSVRNCNRESADTHTDGDTQSENIISAVHYVHLAKVIMPNKFVVKHLYDAV